MKRKAVRWAGVLTLAILLSIVSVTMVFAADSQVDDNSGALVVAVIAGSPASDANLVRGDVILAVGDQPVTGNEGLRMLMQGVSPGDVVPFTVRHGDEEYIVDVQIGNADGRAFLGVYLARDIDEAALGGEMDEGAMTEEAGTDTAEEAGADTEEAQSEEAEVETAGEAVAEEVEAEASAVEVAPSDEAATEEEVAPEEEAAVSEEAGTPEAEDMEEAAEPSDSEEAMAADEETEDAPEVYGMLPFTYTAGGALITAVVDGSPADEAGINVGDVILGADGERFREVDDLLDVVDDSEPGDEVTFEVLRRTGDLEDIAATLGEHPDNEEQAFLGIGFVPTPRRMFLGHSEDGDLLVPPIPFNRRGHGSGDFPQWYQWHPRFHMPEGHPFALDCEDGMPWWACEDDGDSADEDDVDDGDELHDEMHDQMHDQMHDDADDAEEDDASDAENNDNALAPMNAAA